MLYYLGILFAGLFAAKTIWLGVLALRGDFDNDDDEGGPVSGWGTPNE